MDHPKTLVEFMEMYGTEEACRQALFEHRWPMGYACPKCGETKYYEVKTRHLSECASCGHQVSLTSGTILHKTRTELRKWFLAIYLMATTKKALSAAELGRQVGVASQTAWTIRRKIVHAMARRDGELLLAGTIEMDETYIGGGGPDARGRRAGDKAVVAVMAQMTADGGLALAHMRVVPDASTVSLRDAAGAVISPKAVLKTDGWAAYRKVASGLDLGHDATVQGDPRNAVIVLPNVHLVISNFKRWVDGIFHGVSNKHLQSYLDEFCYRLNRRYQRTDLFRRLLNRCCLYCGPITYAALTAAS